MEIGNCEVFLCLGGCFEGTSPVPCELGTWTSVCAGDSRGWGATHTEGATTFGHDACEANRQCRFSRHRSFGRCGIHVNSDEHAEFHPIAIRAPRWIKLKDLLHDSPAPQRFAICAPRRTTPRLLDKKPIEFAIPVVVGKIRKA